MNRDAQALGRLAKGVPKNYSAEEIARRSKILAGINARRRKASKKRTMPNAALSSADETDSLNAERVEQFN